MVERRKAKFTPILPLRVEIEVTVEGLRGALQMLAPFERVQVMAFFCDLSGEYEAQEVCRCYEAE